MKEKMGKKYFWMNLLLAIFDVFAVNGAYFIALNVRFIGYDNLLEIFCDKFNAWMYFAPIYTIICLAVFAAFRLYNGMWKYAGMHDFNRIVFASALTSLIHMIATIVFIERMPLTYYFLGAILQFFFVCGVRLSYRIFLMEKAKFIRHISPSENVMIVGHGESVRRVIDYIENDKKHNLCPVCIIDNRNIVAGFSMNGIPVIGGPDCIEKGIEKYKVRNIFIADPLLDNEIRNQLEIVCEERYLNLHDYSGYLKYLDHEDELLQIVKAPATITVDGIEKRLIPFSPPDISEKEIGEVTEALKSGWITTGPRTKLLERRLAAYIETGRTDIDTEKEPDRWSGRVVCLSSATAAEELNLRILGIKPGDEVIVPAYTYTASASAAIHCGATVKFVDIQRDGDKITHSPEMDYGKLEDAITDKTKAIIAVDMGGIVCDYDRIYEIVEKKKALFTPLEADGTPLGDLSSRAQKSIGRVAVVADCAHSLGASRVFGGVRKYCGAIADFSSFSFHAVKNFTTAEGGASAWRPLEGIDNAELYKMFQLLSLHGQNKDALAKSKIGTWEYDIIGPWYKCNMTDIMAAIGLRQLDRYKGLLERRKQMMKKYDAVCDELGISHMVHHVDGMDSSNHLYLIRIPGIDVEQRNEIIKKMAEHGVATNVHYKPLPMMTAYGKDCSAYPNSFDYYKNLITLPFHTLLSDEDVEYICSALKEVIQSFS